MADTSLYFELSTMALLSVLGGVLLLLDLPGWGLISTAMLLGILSFGLRIDTTGTKLKLSPLAIKAEEK